MPQRGESGAWRRLPALGETIGPPPLVAPARPFAAGLAASNPPPSALQPLAHGHSLEAPRGLVVGIARPLPALGGAALPKPVQRSPLAGSQRQAEVEEADDVVEASTSQPVAAAASPNPVPSAATAMSTDAPARRLVVASEVARPAPKQLTVAALPAHAGAKAGTIGEARAAGKTTVRAPERASSPEPANSPDPAPAAIQRAPIEQARSARIGQAPSTPVEQSDAPRMTLGQTRRLGLGAPIGGGPVGQSTPLTSLTNVVPASMRAPDAPTVTSVPVQRAPVEPASPEIDMPLVARPVMEGPVASAPPGAGTTLGPSLAALTAPDLDASPSPIGPAIGPASRPVRGATSRASQRESPLVSANARAAGRQRAPLTVTSGVQRSPGDAGAAQGSSGSQVKIHRGAAAGEMAGALQARSFTHGAEIYMPDSHGPLTSGTGKALLAHEMTHVAQQRRMGSSLPSEQTPHGQTLEAEAVRAEKSPDMPLASHQASSPATAATTTTAQAMPDLSAGQGGASQPNPQRAPAGGSAGTRTTATSKGGSSHTHTEQELEVLAHQLYHRIGRHLRRELLVDRERLGFALDLP